MNMRAFLFIVVLLASPIGLFVFHVLMSRVFRRRVGNQKLVLLCIVAFNAPVVAAVWCIAPHENTVADFAYALLVYNTFGYFYFHLFNMSETARRIKIMVGIRKGAIEKLPDLERFYEYKKTLSVRLERLENLGQAVKTPDGIYQLRGRVLYAASFLIGQFRAMLGFK